jgi:hypothetical protein
MDNMTDCMGHVNMNPRNKTTLMKVINAMSWDVVRDPIAPDGSYLVEYPVDLKTYISDTKVTVENGGINVTEALKACGEVVFKSGDYCYYVVSLRFIPEKQVFSAIINESMMCGSISYQEAFDKLIFEPETNTCAPDGSYKASIWVDDRFCDSTNLITVKNGHMDELEAMSSVADIISEQCLGIEENFIDSFYFDSNKQVFVFELGS